MKASIHLGKLLVGVMLCVCILGRGAATVRGDEDEEQPETQRSWVHQTSQGQAALKLDAATQKRLHLKVERLRAIRRNPELEAFGRVIDPAPLEALVGEWSADRIAARTSRREYQRVQKLHAENNAATRRLQTAAAAAARDRAAAATLGAQLRAHWGEAILSQSNLVDWIGRLIDLKAALVRIDLPAGERLKTSPRQARLVAVGREDHPVRGVLLGKAPLVDSDTQGEGFFFLVSSNSPSIRPGQSVTAYLQTEAAPLSGVEVPRRAIVRIQDEAWVYLQTGARTFVRHKVILADPTDRGWFVTTGLKPGDRIVVAAVESLLSEEFKSQIQMED